jgi:hypothetical protein
MLYQNNEHWHGEAASASVAVALAVEGVVSVLAVEAAA